MDRGQRAASKKVTIHWEGRPVEACAGDNVASALFAAGAHVLGRSRKFHRPVGLSGSFLAGVKGQVDGLPNQRLDQIPVRPGLAARAQNVWPNGRFDLLRLAGLIPRQWLRGGFEHPVWLPGGSWRFQVWESFLRMMAGGGDPVGTRSGTKQAKVIQLLRRPVGASIEELAKATGWQSHSVRGVISGALKKQLGLKVASTKEDRGRVYRIIATGNKRAA
jgi:Protein of unknown function (DUF3489)/2Fe-2S iron-sulfur cluster binding domain